jgi:uncharacterized membrane protein YhaH (DUF805 family)
MFKNPFSFNGRIRRMEYGLSMIIYMFVYFTIVALTGFGASAESSAMFLPFLLMLPLIWFVWAQGAKRCHDIGRSGWWQLIPFYFFFLLFQDGDLSRNEYGSNPKHPEQIDVLESETLDGHLKN